MLVNHILVLFTPALASALALDYSPKVVSLEASELQRRAACASAGVVNGQCGRLYRSSGCNDQIDAFDPGRCSGTCHSYNQDIRSIRGVGDGTYGTNCNLFSDKNCQEVIGQTGNAVVGGGKCYSPSEGRIGHSI
ncbi:hypothetical protein OQA88_6089 [Cercophora sp. LCS_1]